MVVKLSYGANGDESVPSESWKIALRVLYHRMKLPVTLSHLICENVVVIPPIIAYFLISHWLQALMAVMLFTKLAKTNP